MVLVRLCEWSRTFGPPTRRRTDGLCLSLPARKCTDHIPQWCLCVHARCSNTTIDLPHSLTALLSLSLGRHHLFGGPCHRARAHQEDGRVSTFTRHHRPPGMCRRRTHCQPSRSSQHQYVQEICGRCMTLADEPFSIISDARLWGLPRHGTRCASAALICCSLNSLRLTFLHSATFPSEAVGLAYDRVIKHGKLSPLRPSASSLGDLSTSSLTSAPTIFLLAPCSWPLYLHVRLDEQFEQHGTR